MLKACPVMGFWLGFSGWGFGRAAKQLLGFNSFLILRFRPGVHCLKKDDVYAK